MKSDIFSSGYCNYAWEIPDSRFLINVIRQIVLGKSVYSIGIIARDKIKGNEVFRGNRFLCEKGDNVIDCTDRMMESISEISEIWSDIVSRAVENNSEIKSKNIISWWNFPKQETGINDEINYFSNFIRLCRELKGKGISPEISAYRADEYKKISGNIKYCYGIKAQNDIFFFGKPESNRKNALNCFRNSIVMTGMILQKIQDSVWQVMVGNDTPEYEIEGNHMNKLSYDCVEHINGV